ncbi:MAG: 1-acyl-sn-glycerol-3-phosphate acyltransferase [Bacilli bacterium]|nr:1-acyl-sn-glycerol-3-phosphate acyltransferase [Bacilli bacterium]
MKAFLRFIFKLTGLPSLWLLLRQRYYLEDPYKKTRSIKGGAIFISNHTHIMDFFTMVFAHPFRTQRFLVSEAIYNHPILGFMCDVMKSIMVHRERSDLTFMGEAERTLKKGGVITIFPEGHIIHDGKIDTFKPSVVYLALRTGAPIIPHYIDAHYFRLKRTRIIMGKPFYVRDYIKSNSPSADEVRKVCEILRSKTNELKRKMSIYRKYKTRNVFNKYAWFLDIAKAVLWLPNKIVFPTRFHYVNGATKKDRKIVGRGIIVSKHRGFSDAPILSMHYFSRRVHTIVAAELYSIMGWVLKHLLSIRYDRKNDVADPRCFLEVINLLKGEGVVGIYPEGHIRGEVIEELHDGASYFALMTNSPIHFYYMVKPYKPFRLNHVLIGKTLYLEDIFTEEEMKQKESISKLTKILQERFNEYQIESEKYIKKQKQK